MSTNRSNRIQRNNVKKKACTTGRRQNHDANMFTIRKNKQSYESPVKRKTASNEPAFTLATHVAERLQELDALVAAVRSGDPPQQLDATTKFRKMLSSEDNPPIQDVIDAGVVPVLVGFLSSAANPQLQFEATWALTNIASGEPEQTRYVIESGAIPALKNLLASPSADVREQAIWALGNIAGDSPTCRDCVLAYDVLDPLLKNIHDGARISLVRNATWTLSNLCRGKPQPRWEFISPALPFLAKLLYYPDADVLTDACWALSYISDGPNECIQSVINTGMCKRLPHLLRHPSVAVQTPSLRTVGNIVTGDDYQTQIIIDGGILPCLAELLSSPKKGIRKETCWTISNITAGNRSQIQAVINAQIFPKLIHLLKTGDFDIKKEAAWALSNATSGGSPEQIRYFISENIIEPLCNLLDCSDPRIILVALEGIENILKVGEKESQQLQLGYNPFCRIVENCQGLDKMEELQNHKNDDIYEKAVNILELYFGAEEEEEEEWDADVVENLQRFTSSVINGGRVGDISDGQLVRFPFVCKESSGPVATVTPSPVSFNF